MKTAKKLLSLMLALVMVFALALPMASALEPDEYKAPDPYQSEGIFAVATETVKANDSKYKVYYPADMAEGDTYPVIVWANGTACFTDLYNQLLKFVTSHGYIVVADTTVMAGDGTDQAAAVEYALQANADPSSTLYGHVNVDRIGAMGHSQGGKSAVNAALLNDKIDCLISIAGASNATDTVGLKVPAFFMGGGLDGMVMPSLWVKPAYKNCSSPAVIGILKGVEHCACMFYPDKLKGYVVAWFDAFLKDDAVALDLFTNPNAGLESDSHWVDVECKKY